MHILFYEQSLDKKSIKVAKVLLEFGTHSHMGLCFCDKAWDAHQWQKSLYCSKNRGKMACLYCLKNRNKED